MREVTLIREAALEGDLRQGDVRPPAHQRLCSVNASLGEPASGITTWIATRLDQRRTSARSADLPTARRPDSETAIRPV